jgi:hypothetical protein
MSYLGKVGSRCTRAATACIAAFPRAMPLWYILWLHVTIGCIPLPGHLLGPPSQRLGSDQLRPIPLQLPDPPTPFNRLICAVRRRRVQELHRLGDEVCTLPHTREPWWAPAPALWTSVPLTLDQTRLCFFLFRHGLPLGFDRLDDAVTRFLRAAKGAVHRPARFIPKPTRHIVLLAPPRVLPGSVVASREPPTGTRAAVHGRFPSPTPAFDAWSCHGVGLFFFDGRRWRRSLCSACGAWP